VRSLSQQLYRLRNCGFINHPDAPPAFPSNWFAASAGDGWMGFHRVVVNPYDVQYSRFLLSVVIGDLEKRSGTA